MFPEFCRKRSVGRAALASLSSPRSAAAEAYRSLRTSLLYASLDREVKTVLVTSAAPGDGKTSIAANLGVALAESGKRVLLVDCDLRRPGLAQAFGLAPEPGLTEALLTESLEPAVQATSVPSLSVLAAGQQPPNPGEFISSQRLGRLLSHLREQFDVVLVDSPPVGIVADAAVLAPQVDGVLLVVRAGHTRKDAAEQAKQQLQQVGARLLGAVLNDAKLDRNVREYHSAGR